MVAEQGPRSELGRGVGSVSHHHLLGLSDEQALRLSEDGLGCKLDAHLGDRGDAVSVKEPANHGKSPVSLPVPERLLSENGGREPGSRRKSRHREAGDVVRVTGQGTGWPPPRPSLSRTHSRFWMRGGGAVLTVMSTSLLGPRGPLCPESEVRPRHWTLSRGSRTHGGGP